jgi:hypothetical protein
VLDGQEHNYEGTQVWHPQTRLKAEREQILWRNAAKLYKIGVRKTTDYTKLIRHYQDRIA